jgi:hypothetical protein
MKPLVDQGIFRRIADCHPLALCNRSSNTILERHPEIIKTILEVINKKTESFKDIPILIKC